MWCALAAGRSVPSSVLIGALLCWLGCEGDTGRAPIPPPKHGLPPARRVRELSEAQQLALCHDSVERMLVASDRQVQCTYEAIQRASVSVGPECEKLRADCLAREDDDSADVVTGASLCADQDAFPGADCDLTVAEYSLCVGSMAEHVRKLGEGCGPLPRPSERLTACIEREGCGFFN